MAHTAAINKSRDHYEAQGYQAYTEGQNSFALPWGAATIGGKPDLIALSTDDTEGTIIDVKTGKPSPSHIVQVMLYMYAIPRALPQYEGWVFDGRVAYPDHDCVIEQGSVTPGFIKTVTDLIERLASDTPARMVGSVSECRFCDLTSSDCSGRVDRVFQTTQNPGAVPQLARA